MYICKFSHILSIILMVLLSSFTSVSARSIRNKIGIGSEFLCFDFSEEPVEWFPEELAVMSGLTDKIGIIFAGAKLNTDVFYLKGGIIGYITNQKKISPYIRLDLGWKDSPYGSSYSIQPSLGFHYFHDKYFGIAIHTALYPEIASGVYIWLFYDNPIMKKSGENI